jgi:hypothetical protein
METINISIPVDWLPEQPPTSAELREALRIGLLQLRRQQTSRGQHRDQVRQALSRAGLAYPYSQSQVQPPLSSEQRQALAQRAAAAAPLSDVVIADRADRL